MTRVPSRVDASGAADATSAIGAVSGAGEAGAVRAAGQAGAARAAGPSGPATTVDPRWREAREVLVVRLDNLGDVLMASPALAAIRETLPRARLTLLASPSGVALAAHLPMVEAAIAFRAPWVKQPAAHDGAGASTARAERELVDTLRAQRFDAAVVFTTCTQSALPAALLCRLAGIPLRLAHSRENPYDLLTDWVPDPDVVATGMRHEVARQLALVGTVGLRTADPRLRFAVDARAESTLRAEWSRAGLAPGQRYVVVHPGATAASRRYPAERFGAAADLIARESGRAVVFAGDAGEEALIEAARSRMAMPSWSLGGRLPLGAFGALLAGADLLVANNSGPVHIAAAVGTPVVDVYALTNPQHTPWQVPATVVSHDVACRNCLKSVCPERHHDCLMRIEPLAVAAAALELLGRDRAAAVPVANRPRQEAFA